jgi:hypothetical protein
MPGGTALRSGRLPVKAAGQSRACVNLVLAALGIDGRKAEADVSFNPAQHGPRRDDTTTGEAPAPQFPGLPGPDASGDEDKPAKTPGGP